MAKERDQAGKRYAAADRKVRQADTHVKQTESRGGRDSAGRVAAADARTSRQDAKDAIDQAKK